MAEFPHGDYCPSKGDDMCDCDYEARIRADEREGMEMGHAIDEANPGGNDA